MSRGNTKWSSAQLKLLNIVQIKIMNQTVKKKKKKKQEKLFPVKTRNNSAKRISISLTVVIAPKD